MESYTVNSRWKMFGDVFSDVGTSVGIWKSELVQSFSIFSQDVSHTIFFNKARILNNNPNRILFHKLLLNSNVDFYSVCLETIFFSSIDRGNKFFLTTLFHLGQKPNPNFGSKCTQYEKMFSHTS